MKVNKINWFFFNCESKTILSHFIVRVSDSAFTLPGFYFNIFLTCICKVQHNSDFYEWWEKEVIGRVNQRFWVTFMRLARTTTILSLLRRTAFTSELNSSRCMTPRRLRSSQMTTLWPATQILHLRSIFYLS